MTPALEHSVLTVAARGLVESRRAPNGRTRIAVIAWKLWAWAELRPR